MARERLPDGRFFHPAYGRVMEHEGYSLHIYWNADMIDYLKRHFARTLNEELAGCLGVSQRTMLRKARELGLRKDREWLRAVYREHGRLASDKICGGTGMILSNMTTDEMFRELMIDKDNCIRWREHLRRRVAEIARRGSKFPRFLFYDYLSPRKNQWLVQASIVSRHPYNGILFSSCVVRHAEDGWYMHQAVYNSMATIQMIMTPHCIRRYAERTGREEVKMPELMKVWMMCNHDICGENDESLSGRRSRGGMYEQRHYCSNEGILMGDWHEGKNGRTFMAKTFITYDMAKDRQVEVFGKSRDRLLGIENWRELLTI